MIHYCLYEFNLKGIIVTSSRYTKTSLTYARNKGIGLIRIIEDEVKNEVYRKSRFGEQHVSESIISALEGESVASKKHYISDNYFYSDDIQTYFLRLNVIDKVSPQEKIKLDIPYLSLDEIEDITKNLLPSDMEVIQPTDLNLILNNLKSTLSIDYIINEHLGTTSGKEILGKISFNPLCIYISNSLDIDNHRWRFTFAHELGHCILHTKYLATLYDEVIDTESSLNNSITIDEQDVKRIEYQANLFASSILMPALMFKAVTHVAFLQNGVNRGRLYLDNQPCNQELFYNVASQISKKFNVSIQAVKYRMTEFKLLEDTTGNSLRDLFNKY